MARSPTTSNPRILKLIELETSGRIKPEHQQELDVYRAQGIAPKRAATTEAENKSAGFYARATGANRDFEATNAATNPRGALAQTAADVLPYNFVNSHTSPDRQKAYQAKEDFIRASLRYESGAAISPTEFEGQDRIFFPQPGDSPEVIEQKAAARRRVITSLDVAGGPGADRIDAQNSGQIAFNDQLPAQRTDAKEYTPEQRARLAEIARTGSVADLRAAAAEWGLSFPQDDAMLQRAVDAAKKPGASVAVGDVDNSIKPVAVEDEGGTASFLRGAADTITLGALPRLGAVVDTVARGGTYAENLDRNRGIILNDEQQNGGARIAGQIAGGFALPTFGASSAAELARVGAGYAGGYSFLSSDEDFTSGRGLARAAAGAVPSAAAGAAGGYALARGGQFVANRLANRAAGDPGNPLIEAAQRQGVPLTVADAAPGARSTVGFLETLPVAGGLVRRGLQRGNKAIEDRIAAIGGDSAGTLDSVGSAVQDAGQRYISRSRDVKNQLYDRAETLAGDVEIAPASALRAVGEQLAELRQAPETNAPVIRFLEGLWSDLRQPGLGVKSARDIRTSIRGQTNTDALRATDAERRSGIVLDALSDDIAGQLSGPARRAYQRADRFNRERAQMVDDVVKRFIGASRDAPLSAEQTAGKVTSMAAPGGDAARLSRMMGTLSAEERGQVAGTIASQLGRRGTEGENQFSAQRFFSDIQRFSPAAREAIWGASGARALADLARIAEQRGNVMGRLNNSRSGQASNWFRTLAAAAGGAGAVTAVGAGTTAGGTAVALGGAALTAGILSSRRAVALLGAAARANTPEAQAMVVRRLGQLASREPQLAAELTPLRNALASALPRSSAEQVDREAEAQ